MFNSEILKTYPKIIRLSKYNLTNLYQTMLTFSEVNYKTILTFSEFISN